MAERLSLVLGFRDRDLERVERCLDSLAAQTFRAFDLTLVDYGSAPATARALSELACRYPFCRVLYTETRGWPWNRSQALNAGARAAEGAFLVTTDVDLVFAAGFLEALAAELRADRVVYSSRRDLPDGFNDWSRLEELASGLPSVGRSAYGNCCALPREVFCRLRGFDELYRYWGVEDRDLHHRLLAEGLEEVWLDELPGAPPLFHQWHPASDHKTTGFLPPGFWGRAETHFLSRRGETVRNGPDWGRVETAESRPALAFLDLDAGRLRDRPDLVRLRGNPYDHRFLSRVLRTFWDLPSGHALAAAGAALPRASRPVDGLLRVVNALLRRTPLGAEVGYRTNRVHGFLAELVHGAETAPGPVADYYLGFPAEDGIDLLVRA